MPKMPTDADVTSWHRYFAMDCNNGAWQLTEKDRTPAEDMQMLDAAHAASFHWSQIGTELHRMRAKMLLARVHTLVGNGVVAVALATEVRAYLSAHDAPAWEMALAHAIYAHAVHQAGDTEGHRAAYEDALRALSAVTSEEDRTLVRQTLERVPKPSP